MTVATQTHVSDAGSSANSRRLFSGAVWTFGAYGVGQALRLVTDVMLARRLAPQLFGLMQVVHSLRTGVELITDVGIVTPSGSSAWISRRMKVWLTAG